MFLTTLLASAALHAVPAPLPATIPAQTDGSGTSAETAEGIEILRRLLVQALDEAFETEKKDDDEKLDLLHDFESGGGGGFVTSLWAGDRTIQHARAFHLPGAGLFFALDASLPVIAKEDTDEERDSSDQPTSDEWERIRLEVRGDPTGEGGAFRRLRLLNPAQASPGEIDPKAIEKTTDLLLRTIARHIGRIEGLASDETVTIALRLSGRNRAWLHDFEGRRWTTMRGLYEDDEEDDGAAKVEKVPERASGFVLSTGQDVRQQNLVIRVALRDVASLGEDLGRLRQRVQIHRYPQ